ncbi:ABC exporter membrane fusion protein [Oscillatoria sp. FACHB-1406]|uniref:ABC exporter membrane fusion protein n=1 Tax=Oscillatoria sp. FACHB-1406 TaxID=2692846 RepID=UPI0016834AD4|nr:ABC exporter membrane fusion protein [Oscillatoria sp. FACHB-1406]MBD2578067.1 ABC exporter membrane fusion protein [Oscillatoria sp. FACHB-1406]
MQDAIGYKDASIKGTSRRWVAIAAILLLGVGGAIAYNWRRVAFVKPETPAPVAAPVIHTVTALGRLSPRGETVKLSAPSSTQGNRVDRLLVEEGDRVEVGQLIAVLYSRDRLQAVLAEAQQEVSLAQAKLAAIQAGAKSGEIEAQRAEVARLEADRQGSIEAQAAAVQRLQLQLQNAQTEYDRYQTLYQAGAISASQRDNKQLTRDTAQQSLQEAQATLERLRTTRPQELNKARATLAGVAEVRSVDVEVARAEVNRAIANFNEAKASLAETEVRSPIEGEILDIHTRAGETISSDGIVEIGHTEQMQAIAEVYQSDVAKIHSGQRARVTSDVFPEALTGTVERVGSQVRRQTVVNTDPSANIDSRIIEVRVNLDAASSQKAAKFTNLQVQIAIEQ